MSLKKRAMDELIEMALEHPELARPSMLDLIAALSRQHPIDATEAAELNSICATLDTMKRNFRVK